MSLTHKSIVNLISKTLPREIIEKILEEYLEIKHSFAIGHWKPAELNGGRFAERVIRLLEYIDTGQYTPFGQIAKNETILNKVENNPNHAETIKFFIPKVCRILMGIRNRRDVAHPGGDVNPNFSDSRFVVSCADWILTEIIRHYFACSIKEASDVVSTLNYQKLPVVFEINGFLKIQNTKLSTKDKVLVILVYKNPEVVLDKDLFTWVEYSNISRFKSSILKELDKEAFVHYRDNKVSITPKGLKYAEEKIDFELK